MQVNLFNGKLNPYMSKTQIEQDVYIPDELIKELLTESEWRMIRQRFVIIQLLEEGHSIRYIAEQARVGTDTVVRVAKKVEANPKIREFVRFTKKPSTSKWVFGQVSSEKNFH